MQNTERWTNWTGVVAVVLWIASVVVVNAGGVPGEGASEAEYLEYVQDSAATILISGWLFMAGCAAFLWFAVALRQRLAAAEGGNRVFSNAAFAGAVLVGGFLMLTPGGEIAAAISADEEAISASTVAALRVFGEAYLSAATIAATLLMIGSAVVALRTGVLPRAWARVSLVFAVVLVIGPVGWAALLLGLPLWVLATSVLLLRREKVPVLASA